MEPTLFNISAVVLSLAAAFGYVNHRWLRMPQTIGLVVIALVASLFVMEAFGGAALGLAMGYGVYRALKTIDEHNLEVLMTMALVMLTYGLAFALHVSGPIALLGVKREFTKGAVPVLTVKRVIRAVVK